MKDNATDVFFLVILQSTTCADSVGRTELEARGYRLETPRGPMRGKALKIMYKCQEESVFDYRMCGYAFFNQADRDQYAEMWK